jgi:hypothetical protein
MQLRLIADLEESPLIEQISATDRIPGCGYVRVRCVELNNNFAYSAH